MMDEAALFSQIAFVRLAIPAWQMALYIIITSVFMLAKGYKLCLITTYLFTLYWGFFLYWGEVMTAFGSFPTFGTFYLICGMLHVVLTLVAFFKEG